MKKYSVTKVLITGLVSMTVFCAVTGCMSQAKPGDAINAPANTDSVDSTKDSKFIVFAANVNMKEIQLGKMAQTMGVSADVRDLGKMMQDDHTQSLKEEKDLASKKGITLPETISSEGQKAIDQLQAKNGKDFDKAYCDMMVKGHTEVIGKFDKASTECSDPDVLSWINATLPVLKIHLDHAKACQASVYNNGGTVSQ